jgi:hypothetical protein
MMPVRPPAETRNTNGTILVFLEDFLIFWEISPKTGASGQYKFVADSFASITTE